MTSKESTALTVAQLARKMRNLLEIQIGECWVEGEISNLRKQSSGHQYFTIKDEKAQLSCAFFKGRASRSKIDLKDGMKVRLFAEVSLYEQRGSLQLIVIKAEPTGLGELQARFEELKAKLNQEGLFAQERKKTIPSFPSTIAVVTSPTGAAIQDMINVLQRRAPWVRVMIFPVRVQGQGAEVEIARAIRQLSEPEKYGHPRPDTIIIGRGGGSLEDLWNFNEEVVARAIAACPIPLISAVGHEIDFTISDFTADLRAPTPSAAAELAVPDGDALKSRLSQLKSALGRRAEGLLDRSERELDRLYGPGMERAVSRALQERELRLSELEARQERASADVISEHRQHLSTLKLRLKANHPEQLQQRRLERLSRLEERLAMASRHQLHRAEQSLKQASSLLKTLGPEQTLARGFSITFDENGKVIRDAETLSEGQMLRTKMHHGEVESRVDSKKS